MINGSYLSSQESLTSALKNTSQTTVHSAHVKLYAFRDEVALSPTFETLSREA